MAYKLKRCPFCLGRVFLNSKIHDFAGRRFYYVECDNYDCLVNPQTGFYDEAEEAVKAWNDRRERVTTTTTRDGFDKFHLCVSCNHCNFGWHVDKNDLPFSYCPNCGAKVVEDA